MDIHQNTLVNGARVVEARKKIRWRKSIRGRLTLGTILVTVLAVCSLMLTAIIALVYYYESDQNRRLNELASSSSLQLSEKYTQYLNASTSPTNALYKSAVAVSPTLSGQYLMVVFGPTGFKPAFPRYGSLPAETAANRTAQFLHQLGMEAQAGDSGKLRLAVVSARQGKVVSGDLGLSWFPQPYVVRPIYEGGDPKAPLIGVLFLAPASAVDKTIPLFITQVGTVVLLASLIVVVVVAGAAILFSRSITRPLGNLTSAARKMGRGDYQARVYTTAPDELGELAATFNEMAAQLSQDVEELRKQELWRRELIMNITHDLATPLTAITGLGEALADGVNQSQEEYGATGRIIVRETLRLRRLVKDLHMMAKVDTGALQPQRQTVRLAALVDESLAMLVPEFERAHIEPRNTVSYQLPPVQADPDMLARVFTNLCDNALHHTPSGGSVTIEAQQVNSALQVSIADTGEGIPSGSISQIFERFYRADSARHSAKGGSGLGLAIVRAIIQAHGGRVWAENVPDGGARIVFTLPV